MPFTVRNFQPSDFDTLWHIDQACFPSGISYSRAELRHHIQRSAAFTLVATGNASLKVDSTLEAGKEISTSTAAGFIVAEGESHQDGHIITIDVLSAVRRFGVGSLLLRSAEQRLRSVGCRTVELEAAVDNLSALAFYKRHGYHVVRVSPRYYSNGVDALVMEKNLE
ncbi:MAG TPA: N-acetyltransferase [Candidatus Sulfotelmatobacter sp.]